VLSKLDFYYKERVDISEESKRLASNAFFLEDEFYMFNANLIYFDFFEHELYTAMEKYIVPQKINIFIGGLLGDFKILPFANYTFVAKQNEQNSYVDNRMLADNLTVRNLRDVYALHLQQYTQSIDMYHDHAINDPILVKRWWTKDEYDAPCYKLNIVDWEPSIWVPKTLDLVTDCPKSFESIQSDDVDECKK
jgi:hypothetical protein